MTMKTKALPAFVVCAALCTIAAPVSAQTIETVGERALGMGAAFVAVGTDASATWWNPAALAAGPFVDVNVALADRGAFGLALITPPAGISLYRFRVTDIAITGSTVETPEIREKRRVGVPFSQA